MPSDVDKEDEELPESSDRIGASGVPGFPLSDPDGAEYSLFLDSGRVPGLLCSSNLRPERAPDQSGWRQFHGGGGLVQASPTDPFCLGPWP